MHTNFHCNRSNTAGVIDLIKCIWCEKEVCKYVWLSGAITKASFHIINPNYRHAHLHTIKISYTNFHDNRLITVAEIGSTTYYKNVQHIECASWYVRMYCIVYMQGIMATAFGLIHYIILTYNVPWDLSYTFLTCNVLLRFLTICTLSLSRFSSISMIILLYIALYDYTKTSRWIYECIIDSEQSEKEMDGVVCVHYYV